MRFSLRLLVLLVPVLVLPGLVLPVLVPGLVLPVLVPVLVLPVPVTVPVTVAPVAGGSLRRAGRWMGRATRRVRRRQLTLMFR